MSNYRLKCDNFWWIILVDYFAQEGYTPGTFLEAGIIQSFLFCSWKCKFLFGFFDLLFFLSRMNACKTTKHVETCLRKKYYVKVSSWVMFVSLKLVEKQIYLNLFEHEVIWDYTQKFENFLQLNLLQENRVREEK